MKRKGRNIILVLFLVILQVACVDLFSIQINSNKGYLVVEGLLTTLESPGQIYIGRTNSEATFVSSEFSQTIISMNSDLQPENEAEALLIVNSGEQTLPLIEIGEGFFAYPSGFRAEVGNTYQLEITTRDGTKYATGEEECLPVPPIDAYFEEFDIEGSGVKSASGIELPSNNVYVDFTDPSSQKNFYRWNWTSWELKTFCATCQQGKYYPFEIEEGNLIGECFRDLTLNTNDVYDYFCLNPSWQIFRNTDLNIFSDVFTDGQSQKAKLVAQVPVYQSNPCLVSIEQSSISANAYRYFKLIQDQAVNTGTLADTPPAPIQGNVFNVNNPQELVLGYFVVSDVYEERFMLPRRNVSGVALNGLFQALNNRDPILEPVTPERPEIPLAFCKETPNSTGIMPNGWRFGRD